MHSAKAGAPPPLPSPTPSPTPPPQSSAVALSPSSVAAAAAATAPLSPSPSPPVAALPPPATAHPQPRLPFAAMPWLPVLAEQVRAIVALFELKKETEESWQLLDTNLARMGDAVGRAVAAAAAAGVAPSQFATDGSSVVTVVRRLKTPVNLALSSERSRLSRTAMQVMEDISGCLGRDAGPLVVDVFPTLIRLCSRANRVYVLSATRTMLALIRTSASPAIVSLLADSFQSPSKTLRTSIAECLVCFLECSRGRESDIPLESVEMLLAQSLKDAAVEVRAHSKKAKDLYQSICPLRADAISSGQGSPFQKPPRVNISANPRGSSGSPSKLASTLRTRSESSDLHVNSSAARPSSSKSEVPSAVRMQRSKSLDAGLHSAAPVRAKPTETDARESVRSPTALQPGPVSRYSPPNPSRSTAGLRAYRTMSISSSSPSLNESTKMDRRGSVGAGRTSISNMSRRPMGMAVRTDAPRLPPNSPLSPKSYNPATPVARRKLSDPKFGERIGAPKPLGSPGASSSSSDLQKNAVPSRRQSRSVEDLGPQKPRGVKPETPDYFTPSDSPAPDDDLSSSSTLTDANSMLNPSFLSAVFESRKSTRSESDGALHGGEDSYSSVGRMAGESGALRRLSVPNVSAAHGDREANGPFGSKASRRLSLQGADLRKDSSSSSSSAADGPVSRIPVATTNPLAYGFDGGHEGSSSSDSVATIDTSDVRTAGADAGGGSPIQYISSGSATSWVRPTSPFRKRVAMAWTHPGPSSAASSAAVVTPSPPSTPPNQNYARTVLKPALVSPAKKLTSPRGLRARKVVSWSEELLSFSVFDAPPAQDGPLATPQQQWPPISLGPDPEMLLREALTHGIQGLWEFHASNEFDLRVYDANAADVLVCVTSELRYCTQKSVPLRPGIALLKHLVEAYPAECDHHTAAILAAALQCQAACERDLPDEKPEIDYDADAVVEAVEQRTPLAALLGAAAELLAAAEDADADVPPPPPRRSCYELVARALNAPMPLALDLAVFSDDGSAAEPPVDPVVALDIGPLLDPLIEGLENKHPLTRKAAFDCAVALCRRKGAAFMEAFFGDVQARCGPGREAMLRQMMGR
ncbi:hypothetical protein HK405_006770, partial [Cladochytrium tenue]